MRLEESLRARIEQLLEESGGLSVADKYGQATSVGQRQECSAWLVSAQNAIHLVCVSPTMPYREKADTLAAKDHGWGVASAVGDMAAILRALLVDADAGLLVSVADRARAEVFDDFLDHADAYLNEGRKNEGGVIAGVVFEDALRRLCTKHGIAEKGAKLDALISELAGRGELSGVQAKRARAAAHVRTKASHAQWDEFELEDARAAAAFTREVVEGKIDA